VFGKGYPANDPQIDSQAKIGSAHLPGLRDDLHALPGQSTIMLAALPPFVLARP
jgi:hypothetical protein